MSALRVRYQTHEFGELDVHLKTLRNLNEFADDDGLAADQGISSAIWPLFGVVWASGEVLAHHMLDFETEGLSILEVGCGMGLTSLMLQHRSANVTATDYHPQAEAFLEFNAALNGFDAIPFVRAGWADAANALGRFDLIVGSDLLYQPGYAQLLSSFIDRHANPHCQVIIVDPGRREQSLFTRKMTELGYACSLEAPIDAQYLGKPFRGRILYYAR